MKTILSFSLDFARNNRDEYITIDNKQVAIRYLGVDNNLDLMMDLAHELKDKYDFVCFENIVKTAPVIAEINNLRNEAQLSCYYDGALFAKSYTSWAIKKFSQANRNFFTKKKIVFFSAFFQQHLFHTLCEYSSRIYSLDPFVLNGFDVVLEGNEAIESYLKSSEFFNLSDFFAATRNGSERCKLPADILEYVEDADIVVAPEALLVQYNLEFLQNKVLLLDTIREDQYSFIKKCQVEQLLLMADNYFGLERFSPALMEALIVLSDSDEPRKIGEDEIIQFLDRSQLEMQRVYQAKQKIVPKNEVEKFAFIIHPLGKDYYFNLPFLKPFKPLEKWVAPSLEYITAHFEGMRYGEIKNVVSANSQKKVQGAIYTLFETPDMMLRAPVEEIYQKLVAICHQAAEEGANIIGLGAYTKIVGDAGVTVNKMSPIPVTTGNSLSAASTLWAARICVEKMGIMQLDEQGRSDQPAMIIGSTGSIGSVISKILSGIFKKLIIVAPRVHKLFHLKEQLNRMNPDCEVVVTTDIDKYIAQCPLIITTTSNRGKKLLDIQKVMPGTVICDVSRPFDISQQEALQRPDVLVMANGEVELPGNVQINCDLGLPGKVVYACLAETALLALEGRYESFTLSREISVEKVKDIYKMAIKHGVKLASIAGPTGEITDQEIALCREHALKKLQELEHD